eukprot:13796006-Heterocapsa_arctica.AAC.2
MSGSAQWADAFQCPSTAPSSEEQSSLAFTSTDGFKTGSEGSGGHTADAPRFTGTPFRAMPAPLSAAAHPTPNGDPNALSHEDQAFATEFLRDSGDDGRVNIRAVSSARKRSSSARSGAVQTPSDRVRKTTVGLRSLAPAWS